MGWIVSKVVQTNPPAELRLRAAEFLRLAGEAKHGTLTRELERLARHYMELARDLERRRSSPSQQEPEFAVSRLADPSKT
jgi:hypothetical protein